MRIGGWVSRGRQSLRPMAIQTFGGLWSVRPWNASAEARQMTPLGMWVSQAAPQTANADSKRRPRMDSVYARPVRAPLHKAAVGVKSVQALVMGRPGSGRPQCEARA